MLRHLVAHTRCHSKKFTQDTDFANVTLQNQPCFGNRTDFQSDKSETEKKNRSSLSGCGRNLPWTTDAAVGNGWIVAQILRATGAGNGCTWCLRMTSGGGGYICLFFAEVVLKMTFATNFLGKSES